MFSYVNAKQCDLISKKSTEIVSHLKKLATKMCRIEMIEMCLIY